MSLKKLLLCSLTFLFLSSCGKKEEGQETVKIGVIQSLTGEGAYWGKNGQDGIQLAFDEINAKETKYKYELIWEDSETDASKCVSAFTKLIYVDKIRYCIVDVISSNVLAISPLANQNKIIIISPGASNSKITVAGEYVFRNWPSDALQGKEQAKVTQEILKWQKVAILKINNDYGIGLSDIYQQNLNESKIVANESYEKGTTNFRTQIQKIKESNPDGIYIVAYPEEMPIILRQLKELGLDKPLLGTETFESQDLIDKAGDLAEGLIYTFPESPDSSIYIVGNFRRDFLNKFGKSFGTPADVAYDALYILINAIEESENDIEGVKSALHRVSDYQGASGVFSIDQNGDAIKSFQLKTIQNSKFVLFQ